MTMLELNYDWGLKEQEIKVAHQNDYLILAGRISHFTTLYNELNDIESQ